MSPALTAADFDRDGLLDLAVGVQVGVKILKGSGDGSFRDVTVSYGAGTLVTGVVATDLNRDGLVDLAFGGEVATTLSLIFQGGGRSRGGPDFPLAPGDRDAMSTEMAYALDQVLVEALKPSGVRDPLAVNE